MGTASSMRALRILVVDDYIDFADLVRVVLTREGHHVEVAYDGTTALAMAESFVPHVVVIDVELPTIDGLSTFASMRRMPGLEAVRGVAVTGHRVDEVVARARAAGLAAHLTKPFRTDDLLRAIRS
jgi:CheY-like chemotaxis protein